jgi:hypothetical protein
MDDEQARFEQEAAYLIATDLMADQAIALFGADDAPTLLLSAALKALNRHMDAQAAIGMVRTWMGTLEAAQSQPSKLN